MAAVDYFREEESSIAKVRNKLQPLLTYFSLRKLLDNGEIKEEDIENITDILKECYDGIQEHGMKNLLSLIRNDSIW